MSKCQFTSGFDLTLDHFHFKRLKVIPYFSTNLVQDCHNIVQIEA